MKVKPKEIMVNLPAAHLFQSEEEMASMASAINTIIHGKVKIKYEALGTLGGQHVGLFYIQRNNEFQEIHDEFRRLIEQEEIQEQSEANEIEVTIDDNDWHGLCEGCTDLQMLHIKGQDHCVCNGDWVKGKCEFQNGN